MINLTFDTNTTETYDSGLSEELDVDAEIQEVVQRLLEEMTEDSDSEEPIEAFEAESGAEFNYREKNQVD